jgi:hypothetical protein
MTCRPMCSSKCAAFVVMFLFQLVHESVLVLRLYGTLILTRMEPLLDLAGIALARRAKMHLPSVLLLLLLLCLVAAAGCAYGVWCVASCSTPLPLSCASAWAPSLYQHAAAVTQPTTGTTSRLPLATWLLRCRATSQGCMDAAWLAGARSWAW